MSDMVGRVLMRKRRMLTGFVVGRVQLRKGERLSSGRSGVDRSRDGRLEEGPWKYGLERVEFGISLVSSHGLESSRCRARPSALANFGAPRHRSSLTAAAFTTCTPTSRFPSLCAKGRNLSLIIEHVNESFTCMFVCILKLQHLV